jgi:hypothetical protein
MARQKGHKKHVKKKVSISISIQFKKKGSNIFGSVLFPALTSKIL